MYIEREGKKYQLTAEELLEANAEFVTNWMKTTLEADFGIPENFLRNMLNGPTTDILRAMVKPSINA